VDFLDPSGTPIQRPYMRGAPPTNMVAHYNDYNGTFEVELWDERGFIVSQSENVIVVIRLFRKRIS
jgi:hypothetical protein